MDLFWETTSERFPALEGSFSTDVLVIGGGLCGLLCAYGLHQAGIDYALVEADTICSGVTQYTTAKITAQHGLIYQKILSSYGPEAAKQYFQANDEALERYAQLCRGIDCDFQRQDAYVYALEDREPLLREMEALTAIGVQGELCDAVPLPFPVAGAVKLKNQAQFHPLKFASALSRGLRIYEHTRVLALHGLTAETERGTIQAKRILVTTHFPFLNKHGAYFLKMYQHRSYVLALQNAPQMEGMYVDQAQDGLSFRRCGEFLLLGGGGHRTGKRGGSWQALRKAAKRYYPQATEWGRWATQDCMSLDGIPYIGPYSASTQGLYVATGFNKWGMTSSMAAATLLSAQMQGKDVAWGEVFSPSRRVLHPQLAINAWEATANLLTPTTRRCPHLGCALKWNPYEHTWDCPCHGSRFTREGKLLDGPATGDLK